MGTIHSMKGVLKYHADNYPRAGIARWDDLFFTRIHCEGKQFDLAEFRKMNANLLKRGWALLKELMFEEELETHLKWPKVVTEREANAGDLYSFLVDPDNGFNYLRAGFAKKMLKHFHVGTIDGEMQCQGVSVYLGKARELLNLIAAMMHTTCGGAPRAEEAIQTRILEGKEGRRNLFFMRGKIAWILNYNKSKAQKVSWDEMNPPQTALTLSMPHRRSHDFYPRKRLG